MIRLVEALPVSFVLGDTAEQPRVVALRDADPGALEDVVLEFWPVAGAEPVEAAATGVVEVAGTEWRITLTGDMDGGEDLEPGAHYARFRATLADLSVVTLPPDDRLRVMVYAATLAEVEP